MAPARPLTKLVVAGALIGASLAAPAARADDASCIQSYEQTQILRKESKLRDARGEAAKCAQETCPAVLAKDCQRWLGEIDQSIPTVVFDVRSTSGAELTQVAVTVDGKPLVDHIDGTALPIDVGPHVFRFEPAPGTARPGSVETVIREGERNRTIAIKLAPSATGAAAESRPVPLAAFLFGGAAIGALGAGAVFGIMGKGKESDLDACKPSCRASDVDAVSTRYALSDILLSAGVVSAIAAAYVFFSRPTKAGAP